MTEQETQLTIALERSCAQFEREQRQHAEERQRYAEERQQHSEQVEAVRQRVERQAVPSATLRRQFERLDGQVTGLAQDYGKVLATLRELRK